MLLTYIYRLTTSHLSSTDVHIRHRKTATLEHANAKHWGFGFGKLPISILYNSKQRAMTSPMQKKEQTL